MGTRDNDFYEDDEPVAKIVELFEHGPTFQTRPPERGFNRYFDPFRRVAGAYLDVPEDRTRGSGAAHARPC